MKLTCLYQTLLRELQDHFELKKKTERDVRKINYCCHNFLVFTNITTIIQSGQTANDSSC